MASLVTTAQGTWVFPGGIAVQGNFYGPAECINDDQMSSNVSKRVQAMKLIHQHKVPLQLFDPATAIAAKTQDFFAGFGATGTLVALMAWIEVLADDATRITSVDLKKSTAGGAYASILSAPISITTSTTVRVPVLATIATPAYVANDLFQLVVTVAGAGGTTQAKGLTLQAILREDPA